jgi:hypothetical protein
MIENFNERYHRDSSDESDQTTHRCKIIRETESFVLDKYIAEVLFVAESDRNTASFIPTYAGKKITM